MTEVIEGKTGVRCVQPVYNFRADMSQETRVRRLYDNLIETMSKSPFCDINVAAYLCEVCDKKGIKRNFVELWKTSLLIGL